jgi:enoyl-CoA hydratase
MSMRGRWQRLGVAPAGLRLDNLTEGDLGQMLCEMLRVPPSEGPGLATAIGRHTGGNPFDTVEVVNSLRRDGALTLRAGGWSWDVDAIRRFVGPGNVVGMLLSRIDALLKGRRLTKPLIAAVEGVAIAGGTEILQATDIRVAAESARFGVSEARWGLFPLGGSAVRLTRQIPYTVAADLLLTGRHITAAEAQRIGLVGHVVPDGTALTKALELAESIAANGPIAVQAILRTIRETEGMPENDAFAIEAVLGAEVFMSEDAKEGPRAFAAKRRPEFHGR